MFFEDKFVIFGVFQLLWLFLLLKKVQITFGFFDQLDFLCRFCRFTFDFGRFLGTGRFLDTVSGHRMLNFYWKLCTRIYIFRFFVSCSWVCSFRLLFGKTKSFEKLINGVRYIPIVYKICIYRLSKERLGILKVSLWIYFVFGFFVVFGFFKDGFRLFC